MSSFFKNHLPRTGWNGFVLFSGFVVFVVAVWLFIELADDAPEGDYLAWENEVMLAVRGGGREPAGPAALVVVARGVTALGGSVLLVSFSAAVIGFLWVRRRFRAVWLVVIATLGGMALNLTLKHTFARERPEAVIHLVEVNSPSFPSGHSMASSIFYLTLGLLLARRARRRYQVGVVALAFFLSFLIGLSRVYLGVHYPTDVLAGWTAGTAWALLCCFVAHVIEQKSRRVKDSAVGASPS